MPQQLSDIDQIAQSGTELARYSTSTGQRVVMGWRRGRGVDITDRPVEGRARGYLVDRNIRCPLQLNAFMGDYLVQAARLDGCPMSIGAIGSILAASEIEAVESLLDAKAVR